MSSTVVASQDDAPCTADGDPAGSLKGLSSLVDEEGAKLHAVEQSVGGAHQCAGNDTRLAKEFGIDAYLEFSGATLQAVHLLVPVVCALALTAQLAYVLADGPQLGIVRMGLETALIGERQHLVVDTHRITYTQDV